MGKKRVSKSMSMWLVVVLLSLTVSSGWGTNSLAANVYTFQEAVGSLKAAKGIELTPADWTSKTRVEGSSLKAEVISVTGQSFTKALRLKTSQKGQTAWEAQLYVDGIGDGIKTGDTLLFGFKMRGIESITNKESTVVLTNARLRPNGETNATLNINAEGYISNEWQQYYVALPSPVNSVTGKGTLVFQLGLAQQTIEIADVFVINFGQKVAVNELPVMKKTYVGMEADAQWRIDAQARIEQIRKDSVQVQVVDKNGKPVPNAQVTIQQQRHSFGFGTIVNATSYFNKMNDTQKAKYLETVKSMSNQSGFENELKMNFIEKSEKDIAFFMDWFQKNQIDVRGHVLIYGNWNRLTEAQQAAMKGNASALRQFTNNHIIKYVNKYKGSIYNWDVVNENMTSKDFTDLLGNQQIIEWFKLAHQADSDSKLTLNDFGILSRDTGHQDYHYNLCKYLIDGGAPLTTIGLQGHVSLIPPEDILRILDRFAGLGKEIEITEFTFAEKNEELQAQFTRDFMTAVFSQPSVTSLVTWGFWEGEMYEPDAAMYRNDFSIKPNGQAWKDLIYSEWWTNVSGATGNDGIYQNRAFLGEHKVTVKVGSVQATIDMTLKKGGSDVVAVYDGSKITLTAKAKTYSFDTVMNQVRAQQGTEIIGADWYNNIQFSGTTTVKTVDVTGQPFTKAVRIESIKQSANPWDSQIWVNTDKKIEQGDTLFIGFKMRSIYTDTYASTGRVFSNVRFRPDKTQGSITLDVEGKVNDGWQQYYIAAKAPNASGNLGELVFQFGMAKQTMEIADVFVINFGKNIDVDQLPVQN
ncbi:endo-1,4-beta-xylanase [Anaerosporobacter sp.]|uniref:endo-1,4-beta-xylanase n=1 Tax=Anaerosporobacter sp. TaxID=1872529 RepID=UPI00286F8110|nr:endo-1,4-beta-xylanase [Anaerosporobacter sp.]